MKYRVTECYVDFPMGASPEYTVAGDLSLEEANKMAKDLSERENENNPKSSVYRVYNVREMK